MTAQYRRTFDASLFNAVANHPEVFPWLGASVELGSLDLTQVVETPTNFALEGESGGFILVDIGNRTLEAHSLFLPEGRGGDALSIAKAGFRYLFTQTPCEKIVTKVPDGNRAAQALAKLVGFRPVFSRHKAWPRPGDDTGVVYHALTFEEWRERDDEILSVGHEFHEALEAAKATAGSPLETHPDDDAHDRAVGAAVLMFRAGNVEKGLRLYNEWAAFTGYAQITVLNLNPLIIDVVDAIVEVTRDGMEVLKCR